MRKESKIHGSKMGKNFNQLLFLALRTCFGQGGHGVEYQGVPARLARQLPGYFYCHNCRGTFVDLDEKMGFQA